jgi:ribosomal protein S27E
MTREEKQKAIDALKISVPVRAMTQEEFNDYIQTINQIMDWLEQEPCEKTQMVDKSNFSQEQYRADLQSAYDCGKASVAPCEDAISRQAAIDAIYARYIGGKEAVDKAPASDHYAEGIDEAVCAVENLPPVKPTEKVGHWIETAKEYYKAINEEVGGVNENTPYFTDDIACPECLAKFSVIDNETERFEYCPHCGAKMVEPQEGSGEE